MKYLSTVVFAAAISFFTVPSVQAQGQVSNADRLGGQRNIVWPRWQARVGLVSTDDSGVVLGDYYFSRLSIGASSGGLRATGGLLLGASSAARTSAMAGTGFLRAGQGLNLTGLRGSGVVNVIGELAPASAHASPYLGLGWSSYSLTGGWGLSADVGVTAGRRVGDARSLDELLRDLRLAPVLNVGVSLSF